MPELAEVALRDATHEDLGWIAEREVEIFGDSAWSPELIGHDFLHPPPLRHYRIAQVGQERVGYAVFGFESDAFTLLNLAVAPAWRGRGIARAFLDDFLADASSLRVPDVWLEVAVDNLTALRLYRWYGFDDVRVRRRYYQPGDVDAIVMRRGIDAEAPPMSD